MQKMIFNEFQTKVRHLKGVLIQGNYCEMTEELFNKLLYSFDVHDLMPQ